jgi:hypothetical protein
MGDNGSSWSVPVFVLDSKHADVLGADEDQIPPNGNPHPVNGHFLNANQNQNPWFFDDVADLAEVQQENVNHGLEIPNPPVAQGGNNGWVPWIQQEGEIVDENELAEVNNLAEAAVANMILQHPDQAQHSTSVSSETRAFFRAQAVRTHGPLYSSSKRSSHQDSLLYTQFFCIHPFSISSSIHCEVHLSLCLNISM